MTPYYADDHVTLYHARWEDVPADLLKADVLVTDPPYGVAFQGKNTKHTKRRDAGYEGEDSATAGPDAVRSLLPRVARAAVFPGIRTMFAYPEPADVGCVFCPSGAGIGRWGFSLFHPVLFYGKRPYKGVRPASLESFDTVGNDAAGHPCPKPVRWMRWAVSLVSLPGEVVVDPFAGSGTTLVAAKSLNRKAIGVECVERYCEVAANRLRQEVLGLVA